MNYVNELMSREVLRNTLYVWASALCLLVLSALAAVLVRRAIRHRHARMKQTERVEFLELPLEVFGRTALVFILGGSLYAASGLLALPRIAERAVMIGFTLIGFWQLGLWTTTGILAWLARRREAALEADRAAAGSLGIIGVIMRMVVWAVMGLLALDNLGINITALVAGLGVGGIAVALAVQNILGDLFASLSITLDRPFVLGDFIVVGDFKGNVEHIGVKSTRLRSIDGEQIVLANADLLGSRVRNYGRMLERRVVFSLGVTYETPLAALRTIPGLIRSIVERHPGARFERSHFANYGDFALMFETVYHVEDPSYGRYMDLQQSINFALHEAFERASIAFAYPTQKLFLATEATTPARDKPLASSQGDESMPS